MEKRAHFQGKINVKKKKSHSRFSEACNVSAVAWILSLQYLQSNPRKELLLSVIECHIGSV